MKRLYGTAFSRGKTRRTIGVAKHSVIPAFGEDDGWVPF